jgi:hypothetical protein
MDVMSGSVTFAMMIMDGWMDGWMDDVAEDDDDTLVGDSQGG